MRRLEVIPGFLAKPCAIDPADLPRHDGRLTCADCRHQVVDVASLTVAELAAVRERARHERTCCSYSLDTRKRVLLRASPGSSSLIAVAVSALLAACAPSATTIAAQPPVVATPATAPTTTSPREQASTPAPADTLTTAGPASISAAPAPATAVPAAAPVALTSARPAPAPVALTSAKPVPASPGESCAPTAHPSKSNPAQSSSAPACKPGRAKAHPKIDLELAGY